MEVENCYGCNNCESCVSLYLSESCRNCHESQYLSNCSHCTHCFGCVNMEHSTYCIFNVSYSKEEYTEKLAELRALGDETVRQLFMRHVQKYPIR